MNKKKVNSSPTLIKWDHRSSSKTNKSFHNKPKGFNDKQYHHAGTDIVTIESSSGTYDRGNRWSRFKYKKIKYSHN